MKEGSLVRFLAFFLLSFFLTGLLITYKLLTTFTSYLPPNILNVKSVCERSKSQVAGCTAHSRTQDHSLTPYHRNYVCASGVRWKESKRYNRSIDVLICWWFYDCWMIGWLAFTKLLPTCIHTTCLPLTLTVYGGMMSTDSNWTRQHDLDFNNLFD